MSVALVTGSAGLIGSEACRKWHSEGFDVAGIDNDMRAKFFRPEASTRGNRVNLEAELINYEHHNEDIRDAEAIARLFARYGTAIEVAIDTAAQPSHDWAARAPQVDFGVHALGTLNLLEATRQHCSDTVFVFISTNKVYGDTPNRLPLVELEKRWEIASGHTFEQGI